MKKRWVFISVLVCVILLTLAVGLSRAEGVRWVSAAPQAQMGTSFTYQGRLTDGTSPANGTYDFQFALYDDAGSGTQVGSTVTKEDITVTDGLFTVQLDFGSVAFVGDARYLEIGVRPGVSISSYTTLTPRQPLTPAPYALYALQAPWSGLTGVPAGFADGVDNNTTYSAGTGLTLSGTQFQITTAYRLPQSCGNGQIAEWNGSAWACGDDDTGASGSTWSLSGNAGTTPGTHFLGTTDDQALELHVNGTRALRLEPDSTSPNVIGGYEDNSVADGVHGATIGGGGLSGEPNQVTAESGTVGGGRGNVVTATCATVGGGVVNTASGTYATVSGGMANDVSGSRATVGGGEHNIASGYQATVGGGRYNDAIGHGATISGGRYNAADGDYATVGGGIENIASDDHATVGGGGYNAADGDYATVGGGYNNTVSGYAATVGGGDNNTASGGYATVGGGYSNEAIGYGATIGGGFSNIVTGAHAAVCGGYSNVANGYDATIGGGYHNDATGSRATVPGGADNEADGDYSFAAGRRAKADHAGAFVWADSTDSDFASVAADTFIVRASDGVGLGTNTPQNQLHVQESVNYTDTAIPGGHVVQVENTSTGDNADGLAIKVGRTDNPGYANNFITFFRGDNTAVGAIDGDGSGGVTYRSGGSDYAEFLPRLHPEETIEPGDVVGVFAGRVSKATEGAERVMVVSTRPIVLGNDPGTEEQALYEQVAFIGQVDVKVRGPVAAGDFIVPSGLGDGIGIAVAPEAITPEQFARLVGRAWESSDVAEVKQVRVAVGLPQYKPDLAARIQELEEENAALRSQNTDFEARLAALEQGGVSPVSQLPSPWWLVGGLVMVGLVTQRRCLLEGAR